MSRSSATSCDEVDVAERRSGGAAIVDANHQQTPRLADLHGDGQEAGQLEQGVARLVVVAGEDDDQVARLLEELVNPGEEVVAGGDVGVLRGDAEAGVFEHLADLGGMARAVAAAVADEEVERPTPLRHVGRAYPIGVLVMRARGSRRRAGGPTRRHRGPWHRRR